MITKYHTDVFDNLSEDKKQLILDAAAAEFACLGYSAANINVIAQKAGVSVGSIYKYFLTKENLFLSVSSQSVVMLTRKLEIVRNFAGDFYDRIELILKIIQEHSREHSPMINLYNEITTEGNKDLVKKLTYQMETVSTLCYAELMEKAESEKLIADDIDRRIFAFHLDNIFMSLQFSYASEYYKERMKIFISDDIHEQDEYVLEQTMKFIRRAFSPPQPSV